MTYSHFTHRACGYQLDLDGRRAVISAYERRLSHEIKRPVFGYRVNYPRTLDVQARLLAANLTGEIDGCTPFTTRWTMARRTELVHARTKTERQMDLAEDPIVIVDLGDVSSARFTFIGQRRPLPSHGPKII